MGEEGKVEGVRGGGGFSLLHPSFSSLITVLTMEEW